MTQLGQKKEMKGVWPGGESPPNKVDTSIDSYLFRC